jgi:hypothetical protein
MSTIWIYDTQTGEKRQVTSGMFNDSDPVFDRKGDYLFFASSRVFSRPVYDDLQTTEHRLAFRPQERRGGGEGQRKEGREAGREEGRPPGRRCRRAGG